MGSGVRSHEGINKAISNLKERGAAMVCDPGGKENTRDGGGAQRDATRGMTRFGGCAAKMGSGVRSHEEINKAISNLKERRGAATVCDPGGKERHGTEARGEMPHAPGASLLNQKSLLASAIALSSFCSPAFA
ncbi:MAG TPA: hypothetical protein VMH00_17510 [Candidatus Limnocylindrales bacterium]|nr:hypothetical protein [Candidatus Limnocylindrales bacterium]